LSERESIRYELFDLFQGPDKFDSILFSSLI